MDARLLHKILSQEHESLLSELKTALEYHLAWMNAFNQRLMFDAPNRALPDETASHTQCQFGRWYASVEDLRLTGSAAFARLGEAHVELHQIANHILAHADEKQPADKEQYALLIQTSDRLRRELSNIEEHLRNELVISSRILAKLFENATEGVLVISPEMHVLECNEACTEITGRAPSEIIGNPPDLLYSDDNPDLYEEIWVSVRMRGFWQGEVSNKRQNGTPFLENLSIYSIFDAEKNVSQFLAIFQDVTQERANEDQLYKLAHFDQITGLPNRMLFQDRLQQEIAHARRHRVRAAILFLDIDDFEQVNEQHGREAGDRLIELLAGRLQTLMRSSDSIGRFGGDEFLILVELTNESDYLIVAEKVMEKVASPFDLDGRSVNITASLGISLFPTHTSDAQELVRFADLAMYRAKVNGKNQHQIYQDIAAE
jgi:diguanylate cyclase (GGDEF)-like protein/PAS domain S-box-containing protein